MTQTGSELLNWPDPLVALRVKSESNSVCEKDRFLLIHRRSQFTELPLHRAIITVAPPYHHLLTIGACLWRFQRRFLPLPHPHRIMVPTTTPTLLRIIQDINPLRRRHPRSQGPFWIGRWVVTAVGPLRRLIMVVMILRGRGIKEGRVWGLERDWLWVPLLGL